MKGFELCIWTGLANPIVIYNKSTRPFHVQIKVPEGSICEELEKIWPYRNISKTNGLGPNSPAT